MNNRDRLMIATMYRFLASMLLYIAFGKVEAKTTITKMAKQLFQQAHDNELAVEQWLKENEERK